MRVFMEMRLMSPERHIFSLFIWNITYFWISSYFFDKRPRGHITHSPESYWLIFRKYKHMQSYFSLLPLDYFASKFEFFWLSGILKRFSKIFPIDTSGNLLTNINLLCYLNVEKNFLLWLRRSKLTAWKG
jgi:hypothetical protein